MTQVEPRQALFDEFSLWYLADDMPSLEPCSLDLVGGHSAIKLHDLLGSESGVAADLLREMASDPDGPQSDFLTEIEEDTCFSWRDDETTWHSFQYLAARIASELDRLMGTGGSTTTAFA